MPIQEALGARLSEGTADHSPRDSSSGRNLSRRDFVRGTTAILAGVSTVALLAETEGGSSARASEVASAKIGPRKVRSIENVWIPMSDGVRIATRIWLPEDAEQNPVPAIMDYIPYRKRDGTRLSDETRMPYLASFGYACIRPGYPGLGGFGRTAAG